MKIIATRKAFYNGRIISVGEEIEFDAEKIPSWAKLAKKSKNKDEKQNKPKEPEQKDGEQENKPEEPKEPEQDGTETICAGDGGVFEVGEEKDPDANNSKKLAELEALITKGVEFNIAIDTENRTIQSQIDELKEKIAEAEKAKK